MRKLYTISINLTLRFIPRVLIRFNRQSFMTMVSILEMSGPGGIKGPTEEDFKKFIWGAFVLPIDFEDIDWWQN